MGLVSPHGISACKATVSEIEPAMMMSSSRAAGVDEGGADYTETPCLINVASPSPRPRVYPGPCHSVGVCALPI